MGLIAVASSWVALAALGGFIGGRFDNLCCSTMKGVGKRLKQPENHDISRALVAALYKSTKRFLDRFAAVNPFPNQQELIDRCLKAAKWSLSDVKAPSAAAQRMIEVIQENMIDFLQRREDASDMLESKKVNQVLTDAIVNWLNAESSQKIPEHLETIFYSGGILNGKQIEPWHDSFQKELSEQIKGNDRFEKIFAAELASSTNIKVTNALEKLDDVIRILEVLLTKDRGQLFRTAVADQPLSGEFVLKSKGLRDAVLDDVDWDEIEVGQRFKIKHNLSWDGHTLFMQRVSGQWKPTPILKPAIYHRESPAGKSLFPYDAFLFEIDPTALGDRLFVVVHSREEFPSSISDAFRANDVLTEDNINDLAELLLSSSPEAFELHVSKCRFVAPQHEA